MRDKRLYQKTAGICDMMVLEQLARKKDVSMVKILLLCMLNYDIMLCKCKDVFK